MIEIDKIYTTNQGLDVRLYATDGINENIHGAIKMVEGWMLTYWTKDGVNEFEGHNLKEVWKPKEHEICIFWNEDTDYAVIAAFNQMVDNRFETFKFEDDTYDFCKPYTGSLDNLPVCLNN